MTHETEHPAASFGNAREGDAKHSQARRRLLKALAAGGGAVVATQTVPDRWAKPQIHVGVLPTHAQASPVTLLACSLSFNGQTFGEGTSTTSAAGDVDTDIDEIQATLSPAALVDVTVTFTANGDSDVTFGPPGGPTQNVSTNDAGTAIFADVEQNAVNDGNDADVLDGFTATFSAPGAPNCVITLSFTPT